MEKEGTESEINVQLNRKGGQKKGGRDGGEEDKKRQAVDRGEKSPSERRTREDRRAQAARRLIGPRLTLKCALFCI